MPRVIRDLERVAVVEQIRHLLLFEARTLRRVLVVFRQIHLSADDLARAVGMSANPVTRQVLDELRYRIQRSHIDTQPATQRELDLGRTEPFSDITEGARERLYPPEGSPVSLSDVGVAQPLKAVHR